MLARLHNTLSTISSSPSGQFDASNGQLRAHPSPPHPPLPLPQRPTSYSMYYIQYMYSTWSFAAVTMIHLGALWEQRRTTSTYQGQRSQSLSVASTTVRKIIQCTEINSNSPRITFGQFENNLLDQIVEYTLEMMLPSHWPGAVDACTETILACIFQLFFQHQLLRVPAGRGCPRCRAIEVHSARKTASRRASTAHTQGSCRHRAERAIRSPDSRSGHRLRQAKAVQQAHAAGALHSSDIFLFVLSCSGPMATCFLVPSSTVRGRSARVSCTPAIARLPIVRLVRRHLSVALPYPPVSGLVGESGTGDQLGSRHYRQPARVACPSPAATGRMLTPVVSGRGHRLVAVLWARRTWCRGR